MPSTLGLIVATSLIEIALALILLILARRADELRTFWPLGVVVVSNCFPFIVLFTLRQMYFHGYKITPKAAYTLYFWVFWMFYAISGVSAILTIYNVFRSAMRHLKGLQDLGNIMFAWVAGISFALAVSGALIPNQFTATIVVVTVSQIMRASSILVFSLLLFVCLSIRPMGLSWRNRVFGVSIGLSIVSLTGIIQTAYMSEPRRLYSNYALVQTVAQCIAELIWIYYFARPEPKRKFVLLPTTSPFHKWNQISEMLGHEPGYVAIGGIAPEVFASAEIEIFHRASAKMPKAVVSPATGPVSPDERLRSGDM